MKSLKGKTALVTGASSGIGEAFAWELARLGCNLILAARSGDKLSNTAKALKNKYPIEATIIAVDLFTPGASKKLTTVIKEKRLHVDLLINNAGFGKWSNFLKVDIETYSNMMTINMNVIVELSHLLLPDMIADKSGGIINIGSTGSFQPCPYIAVYCATKAFVLSFSEALYGEYKDKGIIVTAVCPGNTKTSFFEVANANTKDLAFDGPERVAREGIEAFLKESSYTVTGGFGNYMQSLSPRFLPRKTIINIVGNMFRSKVA